MTGRDKAIIFGAIAFVVIATAVTWTWLFMTRDTLEPIVTPVQPESSSSSSEAPVYNTPPIKVPDDYKGGATSSKDSGQNTGDVEKPEPPEPPKVEDKNQLSDPSKPPDYTPEEVAPPTPQQPTTPQPGTKQDGKIYVPGFGWVENNPGGAGHSVGNQGEELSGDKVGIM